MTRARWRLVVAAVVVLALGAGALVAVRLLRDEPTGLARAVTLVPAESRRLLWTDWAKVRDAVGVDLDAGASGAEVDDLVDAGSDADLTSNSILELSAAAMQEAIGFSPATLAWELYAQSEDSAVLLMKLGGGVGTDDVAEALTSAGYVEPEEPDGTWTRDADTTPIATDLDPTLGNIALLEDEGLVAASDLETGVEDALAAVEAADSEPVPPGVVEALGAEPVTAALYPGAQACRELAMGTADPRDQDQAAALLEAAGPVNPLTGFAIAEQADGGVTVALGFEGADQARTNAETRARLAAGPAPGQGGTFAERFAVDRVEADGSVVTMDLTPVEDAGVVSDLSTGPVLFATC